MTEMPTTRALTMTVRPSSTQVAPLSPPSPHPPGCGREQPLPPQQGDCRPPQRPRSAVSPSGTFPRNLLPRLALQPPRRVRPRPPSAVASGGRCRQRRQRRRRTMALRARMGTSRGQTQLRPGSGRAHPGPRQCGICIGLTRRGVWWRRPRAPPPLCHCRLSWPLSDPARKLPARAPSANPGGRAVAVAEATGPTPSQLSSPRPSAPRRLATGRSRPPSSIRGTVAATASLVVHTMVAARRPASRP